VNIHLTDEEIRRFHSKIARGPGCWLWQKCSNNQGYGRFEIYRDGKRVRVLAHRLAYELASGVEPGSADVRHDCDTPLCCRPDHLQLGTRADNMNDAVLRGRMNRTGLDAQRQLTHARVGARLERGEKVCSSCLVIKPLEDFHRAKAAPDGRHGWCKACRSAKSRDAWQNDPAFKAAELARGRRSRARRTAA
jgi:hypothetical protein